MDHRMPDMDGVEATERIRALDDKNPYYKDLPIVALTANAVFGMKEMFLQSGFNDFLSKPIDTVKLNTILENWIPKEKQSSPESNSMIIKHRITSAKKSSHVAPHIAMEIEGLDVKRGVALSGGTVELFLSTLATFSEDARERIGRIGECCEIGNIPLYTTYVHALKGAAANIGADKLSEAAYNLEMAGQRGDLGFIKSNNDHFLTMLEQLLSSIDNALSSLDINNNKAGSFDSEQFKIELAKLESALANMDLEAINHIVDRLLALAQPGHVKNAVKNISKHILLFEYEEANALIKSLLQHCSVALPGPA
jgi:CheY-like chemotaxis protein